MYFTNLRYTFWALWLTTFFNMAHASQLKLQTGQWEGISTHAPGSYYVLRITESQPHHFFDVSFASGLLRWKRMEFNESDVSCNEHLCNVIIPNQYDPTSNLKLIMTPHFDDNFRVLKIALSNENTAILSDSFLLELQSGTTVSTRFYKQFADNFKNIAEGREAELKSLWVGYFDYDHNPDLLVLQENQNSELTLWRYFIGMDLMYEIPLTATELEAVDGRIVLNSLASSKLHSSEILTLSKLHESTLTGFMESRLKEKLHETGKVQLHNVDLEGLLQ